MQPYIKIFYLESFTLRTVSCALSLSGHVHQNINYKLRLGLLFICLFICLSCIPLRTAAPFIPVIRKTPSNFCILLFGELFLCFLLNTKKVISALGERRSCRRMHLVCRNLNSIRRCTRNLYFSLLSSLFSLLFFFPF